MNLIEILLDIYPEVGFLEHSVVLFLTSGGNTILFSIVAVPVYIPTNSCTYPLLKLCICCLIKQFQK